jgi:hypothetical protein
MAKAQAKAVTAEFCRHLAQNLRAVHKNPDLSHLTTASALGQRPQTVALCTSNPTYVISHETLCRPSGTTLDKHMPRDGPPIAQRTLGLGNEQRQQDDHTVEFITPFQRCPPWLVSVGCSIASDRRTRPIASASKRRNSVGAFVLPPVIPISRGPPLI